MKRDCPICGKPASEAHTPFCSGRCLDVDLNKWFSGSYAVPVVEQDESSDEYEAPPEEPMN